MIKKVTILTASLCLLFTMWSPAVYPLSAQGQGQITVTNSNIQADYPNSLTFSCRAQSNVDITDIRLEYQVEQMSFAKVTSEAKIIFDSSLSVNATYSFNMLQYGQIPPGVDIDYWWVIKDAAGNKLQTDPNHYIVVDTLQKWTNSIQGKINLYWYGQNQSFGQAIMSEAQTALTTIASNTGATPDQTVNITVYTSGQDYMASVMGVPEWSGGIELSRYNSIFVVIDPGALNLDLPAVAHELTHIVVGQITSNPYNSIPFWLNEGLAMHIQYAEANLPSRFTTLLSSAATNNNLISVRSLSDPFSAYADKADLSYAESVSVVDYLIKQYGSSKMNQLLETFHQGSTYDGALQANYGFDMDGLFNQWKAWVTAGNGNQLIH
jgi:hypothetical protein